MARDAELEQWLDEMDAEHEAEAAYGRNCYEREQAELAHEEE